MRKLRGDTQKDVASVLSVDMTTYGAYERGETWPKIEILDKIVEYFKVNLHDLVFTDMEKYPEGKYVERKETDPRTERLITRLNLEIDRLAEEAIARASPKDIEELERYRAELIKRYPDIAASLGIKE